MSKLSHSDLYSLEQYSRIRPEFRTTVMEHKKNRHIEIGEHAGLYFEDNLTMKYQVQEMLRIERLFEAEAIQDELDVYNDLVPDGGNLKATFMLEYSQIEERKKALASLVGVEHTLYMQVEGFDPVKAIANEDLERSTDEKTSAVHFVRFEFSAEMISALKQGAALYASIEHENYPERVKLMGNQHSALLADFA
ncbi:MAG: DUF3501 family protein [Gammaproteobacteria bacterium]|nr:DUF3501 family protein [Gammaproteobacteria bacterium]